MGVTVQQGVNAAGVDDHIGGGPGLAVRLDAQVGHGDDILGALLAGSVYGVLYGSVQLFAALP